MKGFCCLEGKDVEGAVCSEVPKRSVSKKSVVESEETVDLEEVEGGRD